MILIDLNVLLDVIQERQPHCAGSSSVLERVVRKQVHAVVPAHAVTTIHYLVARYRDETAAHAAVDWCWAISTSSPSGGRNCCAPAA